MASIFIFIMVGCFIGLMVLILPTLFGVISESLLYSSLEAGFLSTGIKQKSFSIQFFILLIIFIVFDLELLFLFSLISSSFSLISGAIVLTFMISTLWLEWGWNKLSWWT